MLEFGFYVYMLSIKGEGEPIYAFNVSVICYFLPLADGESETGSCNLYI